MFPPDPNEPRLIRWMRNPGVRRTLILSLLWLVAAGALFQFREVLLPFGLAVLIAFVIEPVVSWAADPARGRLRLPRFGAILIIYTFAFLVTFAFVRSVLPQLGREIARLGSEGAELVAQLELILVASFDKFEAFAIENHVPIDRQELEAFVRQNIATLSEAASANAGQIFVFGRRVVVTLIQVIFGSFLVLMVTAFLSADARRIENFALSLVPPDYLRSYKDVLGGITRGLGGVVRGQILICLTNGFFTFIGLWLLEVRFPFVLALVATVFSLIPIFGSILSTVPIVLVALTDSVAKGLFSLLWIIGIHIIEANVLNPKIMGDAARIHPVLVVFALIAGERTSGLIGALFAVPIATVIIELFKFLHRRALEAGHAADKTRAQPQVELTGFPPTVSLPPPPERGPPPAGGATDPSGSHP